jgi:hypothetical protein
MIFSRFLIVRESLLVRGLPAGQPTGGIFRRASATGGEQDQLAKGRRDH